MVTDNEADFSSRPGQGPTLEEPPCEGDGELEQILRLVADLSQRLTEANEEKRVLAALLDTAQAGGNAGGARAPVDGASPPRAREPGEEAIVSLLKQFREHCERGNGDRALLPALDQLVEYANASFAAAQTTMDQIDHPARETHRREHAQFLECMALFRVKLNQSAGQKGGRVPWKFLSFFEDWVRNRFGEGERENPRAKLGGFVQKALVADDSLTMRKLLIRHLSEIGIEDVDEASNGYEALALATKRNYQVVLLDWVMPGLTGIDVLRTIRARGSHVPVIMVTSERQKSCLMEAIKAGTSHFVVKPVSPESLLGAVQKVLREAC